MKKIKLTKGKYAIVDDEDFEWLNKWKWHLSDQGYAHRSQYVKLEICKYTSKVIKMHRVINNTPKDSITDHKNQNKLDNQRKNLRTTNKSLNGINRKKPKNNISGYKGVYFDSWTKKWRAEIKIYGKKISLGRFINIKDAIIARKKGEKKYHAIRFIDNNTFEVRRIFG